MRKPKFQLKNVKYHQGMEGQGVNADIFINGKKCLHVRDDGNGGCFDYRSERNIDTGINDTIQFNIKLMDDYIDSVAPKEYKFSDNVRYLKYDRDMLFDDLLNEHEESKTEKKINKLCNTAIVFGNKHAYGYLDFKKPLNIVPKNLLTKHVEEIKEKYCTSGEMKILNKNLTMFGITL